MSCSFRKFYFRPKYIAKRILAIRSMEDIKRVAGTYFEATNRTVLDVMPGTDPDSEEK